MNGRRPVIASRNGVVAAAHPLAAAAGAQMLAHGGNAFDAAVAAAAAMTVAEPYMSGLAGFGLATCWAAGDGRMRTLQFGPTVPRAWPTGRITQRAQLHLGPLAVAPAGNLAGWYNLLSAHGTRRFADAMAPAIALAREGVPLIPSTAARINDAGLALRGQPFFDDWAATYTAGKGEVRVGDVLRQPDLADTLQAIAEEGTRHLYHGALGEKIVAHLAKLGGVLGMADLEDVSPDWGRPITAKYRDLVLHAPAPPCQAFQLLLSLRLLGGTDLAALPHDGVEHLDAVWRAVRLAAMERVAHDDPTPEALEELLGDANVARLRARLADARPIEGPVEQWTGPAPEGHTTSIAAADRAGNLVALTQSLGSPFGSGIVVPGTGVCLNNALYWGEPDPAAPNALRPGRTLTNPMAPTLVTRAGASVLAIGTPGSYGICQTLAQALVQYLDFKLPLQQAVEAPRARLWDGRRVVAEGRIAPEVLEKLGTRGHVVETGPAWTPMVGGMQAVALDPVTHIATGAADPRREGMVVAG